MNKIANTVLAIFLITTTGFSQVITGGAGVCNVTGDPDNITAMQTQDERYDCVVAWDENNQTLYVYNGSLTIGNRWNEYSGSGDNLGNHTATQNLDMDDNAITDVDRISGGVAAGPSSNVGEVDFNEPVGTGVVSNAMTFKHNAAVVITSDRNNNASTKSDEPIILSQGSINTDDPGYVELLRTYENKFRILDRYDLMSTAPPSDGDDYVQSWVNGIPTWENLSAIGSGGGIWQVQNTTNLATDNTSNNYHRGNLGIGDFSSTTIGATFHIYDPAMTVRLSDSCSTDQCATPHLEFYRGRNTSLLGRVGFLNSTDSDFSFINNLATGKLKFGTDATVKLELLADGQMRLNQYTANSSFAGTVAGYLAFDSQGYIITDSGTSGGGTTTFTGLTDTPNSFTGQGGQYLRVNTGETALEYVNPPSGGGTGSNYPTTTQNSSALTYELDLNTESTGFFTLVANTRTRYEITSTNEPTTHGGHYSILANNTSNDTISFDTNFKYATGANVGSLETTANGVLFEFFYDGSNFYTDEIVNVNSISAPTCWDGVQNGDETGVDCGGSCPDACGPTCSDGIQNGDETGVDCGGSSCPPCSTSYEAEYDAILTYATNQGYTLPSSAVQDDQNQLVADLKTAGIWDSLDVLYVFAGDGDRDFALINWVDTSQFNGVINGTVTFTANEGVKGNGTNGYINTGYSLANDAVNYKVDYGQIFTHIHTGDTDWQNATAICGARANSTVTNPQLMIQNSGTGSTILRMQSYGNTIGSYTFITGPPPAYDGTFFFSRVDGSTLEAWRGTNRYLTGNTHNNHPTFPTEEVYIFANNTGGTAANFGSHELSIWGIGAFDSNKGAFYTAWNTYKTAMGGL